MNVTRRRLLQSAAAVPFMLRAGGAAAAERAKLPVAAVVTEYRNNSHADVIIGKILEGWRQDGGPGPDLKLVAMYVDQTGRGDMSSALAKKHGFRLTKTIDEALTLGTDKLQVKGVLNIGEHGNYPSTPKTKQKMYPRRRFLDGVAKTFQRTGMTAPVFSDKHLAYNWSDAKKMYDTSRRMKFPFMAGSSLPVAWRRPALELKRDTPLEEALAIGYGGRESYGFHALETLQCMVERRQGGETGVKSVQAVTGDSIFKALDEGRWSEDLFVAALTVAGSKKTKQWREKLSKSAAWYLIEYRDGFKATVAMANGVAAQFSFAARIKGRSEPAASWFWLEDGKPYGHFEHLLRAIENMIHTGAPSYPVERTLLTTGVLDEVMHGLVEGETRRETPHLAIKYRPADWTFAKKLPEPSG